MSLCCRALSCALLFSLLNAPLKAQPDDEAWIEAFLAQSAAVTTNNPSRRAARRPVAVDQIGQHVGSTLRLSLKNGSRRVGRITDVDAETVSIRARLQGGYAEVQIPRQQIASAETE